MSVIVQCSSSCRSVSAPFSRDVALRRYRQAEKQSAHGTDYRANTAVSPHIQQLSY